MDEQGIDSQLLSTNISHLKFVAWDTETTGIRAGDDHIVEIAALSFDEDFEQRRFEQLILPPRPISADSTRIHGITDEMVKDSPRTGEGLAAFFDFLKWVGTPRVLLAHNAGFDVGMVHGEAPHAHFSAQREIVLDTCMMAKTLLPDLPMHGLEALTHHFKIKVERAHRAMDDVCALHAVFMKLLSIAVDQGVVGQDQSFDLSKLIDLCGGYFVLDPENGKARKKAFRLPPRLQSLEEACGTEKQISIVYGEENGDRYITPISIRMKGFKVYVEAFCHRDSIKKTFRADKILRIGRSREP